jgi:hypothetical protein
MNSESPLFHVLARNGGWLLLPILAITFGLWGLLPSAYSMTEFWRGIPAWIAVPENVLRIVVLALPWFLYVGAARSSQRLGWILWGVGVLVYLASYLLEILAGGSVLGRSVATFAAPAWTTALWLAGMGLVADRTWLPVPYHPAIFLAAGGLFWIFHTAHAVTVGLRG